MGSGEAYSNPLFCKIRDNNCDDAIHGYSSLPATIEQCDILSDDSSFYVQPDVETACKNSTTHCNFLKYLPLLPSIDNNDLYNSLNSLINRFQTLNITDPTQQLGLAISVFPEEIISSFTKTDSKQNFNDFKTFIRNNFMPKFSIHNNNLENENNFAQITARVNRDLKCPKQELFKFYFIQRAPAHLQPQLREHVYLDVKKFERYAKILLDNDNYPRTDTLEGGDEQILYRTKIDQSPTDSSFYPSLSATNFPTYNYPRTPRLKRIHTRGPTTRSETTTSVP